MPGLRDQTALSVLCLSLLVRFWTVNGLTDHSSSEISHTDPEQHVEDRRATTRAGINDKIAVVCHVLFNSVV